MIGLGTVGQWLLRALADGALRRYDLDPLLMAVASRSEGYVLGERGLDPGVVLRALAAGTPLADLPGVRAWPTALEGLAATEADILVEVSQGEGASGEPGLSHIRHALERGMAVATSNKWPVARAGVELVRSARESGTGFRAESTVMSGTPVVSALTDGIAGARPLRIRGVVNATVNSIASRLDGGRTYEEALAEAQRAGLAERDPTDDVDGRDSVAKLLILSALVFGNPLELGDVDRRGISAVTDEEVAESRRRGERLREVMVLDPHANRHEVRVRSVAPEDPLFDLTGAENMVLADVEPLGTIAIRGPGAGPQLAGQGVLSDLIALARGYVS